MATAGFMSQAAFDFNMKWSRLAGAVDFLCKILQVSFRSGRLTNIISAAVPALAGGRAGRSATEAPKRATGWEPDAPLHRLPRPFVGNLDTVDWATSILVIRGAGGISTKPRSKGWEGLPDRTSAADEGTQPSARALFLGWRRFTPLRNSSPGKPVLRRRLSCVSCSKPSTNPINQAYNERRYRMRLRKPHTAQRLVRRGKSRPKGRTQWNMLGTTTSSR